MTSTLVPEIVDKSTTLTTSSATILLQNNQRKALLIQNVGAVNAGVNILGSAAAIASAGTVTLIPGDSLAFSGSGCPTNGFTGIAASSTCVLTVWEMI